MRAGPLFRFFGGYRELLLKCLVTFMLNLERSEVEFYNIHVYLRLDRKSLPDLFIIFGFLGLWKEFSLDSRADFCKPLAT